MKHYFRITPVVLFLTLLFSMGATAQTKDIPQVKQNKDGTYNKDLVIETFKSYVDSLEKLPEDEMVNDFVYDFLKNMGPDTDTEFDLKEYRHGDEKTPKLSDDESTIFISNVCTDYLKQKKIDQSLASSNPGQQDGTTSLPNRTKLLTYKQIAIRIGIGVVVALALFLLVFFTLKSKKKKKQNGLNNNPSAHSNLTNDNDASNANNIIIRQKTSTVMLKQNLDDVIDKSNYLAIDCTSFCDDTAVRKMYIKNTCILDIYNRYAEDLRNPNNPKEDGCMVLGRWVHDEKQDEYDVSLEEVVFPGDDAVFAEYELDFGGKIKVKVNEKLRKLRRETNLQYDLTCWVHSHPGLGVFFSNTDCSLHMLHKHPTQPKFLTAIVIDILTPQQELGVFTFKHDMSINSKADLKQLYSLEEWYKWALESKRNAVADEEHYNSLGNAKSRNNGCYNVQLSNSTIVDMDLIANNPERASLYFVHGFTTQQSDQATHMAVKIENTDTSTDNELVGCFMAVTHRGYPTIKKAVANHLDKIKFVLVYSITDGTLTTIPVIANDLCSDEAYYGEQPLEELKIWTRRKR